MYIVTIRNENKIAIKIFGISVMGQVLQKSKKVRKAIMSWNTIFE